MDIQQKYTGHVLHLRGKTEDRIHLYLRNLMQQ